MNEVILTALIGIITNLGTWYAARRKNTAEVQANELDNVNKAVKYYREMLDDFAQRYKKAIEELEAAKAELVQLEERFTKLAIENRALIEELKKYKQLNGKTVS